MQTRARGVTQTYSAHSFKDFTVKPGEDVSRISGDAWLRAGSGFAVIGGMEEDGEREENEGKVVVVTTAMGR